ncbi:MAG: SCP2 sterol-binding domain-containing protein [Alcanivoracaceae bacterium]|jgi:ubiquinone biosynthesis protein UbiJ|nr:SCP2 sterol-binding domain-containing protein [Alcanivoracaceae bacterium]
MDTRAPNLFEATALATLERAINTALQADALTLEQLREHSGRLIAAHLNFPPLSIYALIVDDGIELYHGSEAEADVTVRGGPIDLAAQLFEWKTAGSAIAGPVQISGDRELLQNIISIMKQLDLNWAALMQPLLGSELAQQIEYGARRAFSMARQAFDLFLNRAGDFLREESSLMALRRDVVEFNQDVDELRSDADRLAARISRLKQHSEAGQ